ncbi:hypothetical protein ALC57_16584 [Trachymyrmex cornetzi]|uniref:Uncharacterized protein n=1 Tax=Trachymyrmex cornetzi TaxID=471704 RepID=A0A151IUY8_9HYME|nr:hypothetical protein ALC57_16584 [Trachymyrmex cornetzi]
MDSSETRRKSSILISSSLHRRGKLLQNAIINFYNNHLWCEDNPHAIVESRSQQFLLNVWVGIVGDFLIGPYFLPLRLDGALYREFLEEDLPQLLQEVPLMMRHTRLCSDSHLPPMCFMHGGAPAYFSITVRQYLDRVYNNRWIGRAGTQLWPSRSPDLNPLDYFLWGHLKSLVYITPIENENDLRNRIVALCEAIRNTLGIFEHVRQSLRRLDGCIMAQGGHFQQFI